MSRLDQVFMINDGPRYITHGVIAGRAETLCGLPIGRRPLEQWSEDPDICRDCHREYDRIAYYELGRFGGGECA